MILTEEHILRLDVAVHHPTPVRVIECIGDLARNANGVTKRKLSFTGQPIAQRPAIHEGHHVVQRATVLTRIVQRKNVRMLESRRDEDLALETIASHRGTEFGMQHLERHRTVVLAIVCQKDHCHPAAPQLALDDVAILHGRVARLRRRMAQLLGDCAYLGARLGIELGPQACSVRVERALRVHPLAGRRQGRDQAEIRSRLEGIDGHEPAPPVRSLAVIAIRVGVPGKLLDGPLRRPGETHALEISPAVELVPDRDIDAIEERSAVEICRELEIVARERRLKLAEVGDDDGGIEAKHVGTDDEIVLVHRLAQCVECLGQRLTAA